jgi:hypothetical protein
VVIGYGPGGYSGAGTTTATGGTGGTGGKGKRRVDDTSTLNQWSSGVKTLRTAVRRIGGIAGQNYFTVYTAGTTLGVEPTWLDTPSAFTTDGTVVWVCVAQGTNQDDASGNGGTGGTGANGITINEQLMAA